jgi:L-ascorbate metabolism protein UlaG (beta-lactamase superfamily)
MRIKGVESIMNKVKINYLYHSSFSLETENHFLVFDYFNDDSNGKERIIRNGIISEEVLKIGKKIYIFSSHSHGDHFNEVIFQWIKVNPDIKYILSSDIKSNEGFPEYVKISEDESIEVGNVLIKAFGSTDIGISFLVNVEGVSVFHAGDLNWWHWKDENDEYNADMAQAFKSQIEKIKKENIDIAFFPVDPRLEEYYYMGGQYFIEKVSPKMFIPMHFGDKYNITEEFAGKITTDNTAIVEIRKRGQEIVF